MIATIIPYFLMVSISDKATWPNGPEFKFQSDSVVRLDGTNRSIIYGVNLTNELLCHPKTETKLQCQFRHIELLTLEINPETKEEKSSPLESKHDDLYKPLLFEVEFNKNGVNKVITSKNESDFLPKEIAFSIASLLNVGTDLTAQEIPENRDLELNKNYNFLIGECNTKFDIGYISQEQRDSDSEDWLDLVDPLKKLNKLYFRINKEMDGSKCKKDIHFFWANLMIMDMEENGKLLLDVKNLNETMKVTKDGFMSNRQLFMDKTKEDSPIHFSIYESSTLKLEEVRPAESVWPEIQEPVETKFQ